MTSDRRRRALLVACLGFLSLEPAPRHPALAALHALMDSWRGIGLVVVALDRDGYRVTLSKIAAGEWRAQTMTSADGYGVAGTPWVAVQRAALVALKRGALSEAANGAGRKRSRRVPSRG